MRNVRIRTEHDDAIVDDETSAGNRIGKNEKTGGQKAGDEIDDDVAFGRIERFGRGRSRRTRQRRRCR